MIFIFYNYAYNTINMLVQLNIFYYRSIFDKNKVDYVVICSDYNKFRKVFSQYDFKLYLENYDYRKKVDNLLNIYFNKKFKKHTNKVYLRITKDEYIALLMYQFTLINSYYNYIEIYNIPNEGWDFPRCTLAIQLPRLFITDKFNKNICQIYQPLIYDDITNNSFNLPIQFKNKYDKIIQDSYRYRQDANNKFIKYTKYGKLLENNYSCFNVNLTKKFNLNEFGEIIQIYFCKWHLLFSHYSNCNDIIFRDVNNNMKQDDYLDEIFIKQHTIFSKNIIDQVNDNKKIMNYKLYLPMCKFIIDNLNNKILYIDKKSKYKLIKIIYVCKIYFGNIVKYNSAINYLINKIIFK